MRSTMPDHLREMLLACADDHGGEIAGEVAALGGADPDRFAAALCTIDGTVHDAGDAEHRFTIQSMSKPFAYALALADRGLDAALEHVGVEPSGDSFNEISLERSGRPRNPMINIGAIATHALIGGKQVTVERRSEMVQAGLSAFAGRDLEVDEVALDAERASSSRNMAMAYLVDAHGKLEAEPHDAVDGYMRQCSLRVDVRDLAVMAMTLAGGGRNPVTGERVVPGWVCVQVLSVMSTCGMYDATGDWMSMVGIPAKSGITGGILGALPGQVGVGTFSARLDEVGNSVRGVRVFELLSERMGLHLMHAPELAAHVRAGVVEPVGGADAGADAAEDARQSGGYELAVEGTLHFAAAEAAMRELAEIPADGRPIELDLTRAASVNDIGRRLLREGVEGLERDGHEVRVTDPEGLLAEDHA